MTDPWNVLRVPRHKGIIFSIDSIISLLLFLIALVIISGSLVPNTPRTTSIKDLAYDILSVLDASDRYEQYIEGDSSAIRDLLTNTPSNVCMDIQITEYLGNTSVVSKPNCGGFTRELQSTYSSFAYGGKYYTVQLLGWER